MIRGWGIAAVLAGVALTGCQSEVDRAAESADDARRLQEAIGEPVTSEARDVRVTYQADGSGALDVAWLHVAEITPDGMSQSEQNARYSSSHQMGSGRPAGLTVQAGTGVDEVSCTIIADGIEIARETSTGAQSVVTCSALVP